HHAAMAVKKILMATEIKEPSIFTLFSNGYYQVPNENIFSKILEKVTEPRCKYHLYHLLGKVRNELAENFRAYDIQFSFPNNAKKEIAVNFTLTDEVTLIATQHQLNIYADIANKIFTTKLYPEASQQVSSAREMMRMA